MSAIEPFLARTRIAYFSMEIGLRPEMHTYSGGLGILAGDTVRSIADLAIPAAFVTLVSRSGYIRQELDGEGRQTAHPDPWNPEDWAEPLETMVKVTIEGRAVWIRPWLHLVNSPAGHDVPVILLDTDIDINDPRDRKITDRLYGGDEAYRLKQEAVLGLGGEHVLRALGFTIRTYHMNEGHAALLTMPLLDHADEETVRSQCVFTTHTPIEAGHDRFSYELAETVLGEGVDIDRVKRFAGAQDLNMTKLGLNLSGYVNGVAEKHAETTSGMFPGYKIHAITNGVHMPTWTHPAFAALYQAISPSWALDPGLLAPADQLSDDDVAGARRLAKRDLIADVKARTGRTLDPDLPLLVFARRMTGYKRADLLFQDPERLRAIHERTPFQLVVAGKAHPRDLPGQKIIQDLHRQMKALDDITIVYVPNYNMEVAKPLVAGADIWLNTPLPPLEASGTSGMKAALNGALNLSTLDGWWLEACIEGVTGWGIDGPGSEEPASAHAAELYDKLGGTVLPLYHEDHARWLWMVKQSISKIAPYFNTHRMVRRYLADAYDR